MNRRNISIFCVLMCLSFSAALANTRIPARIAGGQPQGIYSQLSSAIAMYSAPQGEFTVLSTDGSVENLDLLRQGKADFAIVQSDILHRALRGHDPFNDPVTNVIAVTPLYSEVVHVLVRSELYIATTDELKGRRIAMGPEGSGTNVTARALLEASGVSPDDIKASRVPLSGMTAAFRDETIDAAFLTSALPSALVHDVLKSEDARLLYLTPRVLDRLDRSGLYREVAIPSKTYPTQDDVLTSVAVQAVWVTREGVDPLAVEKVVSALQNHQREIERSADVHLDLLGAPLPFQLTTARAAAVLKRRGERFAWVVAVPVTFLLGSVSWLIHKKRQFIRHQLSAFTELILGLAVLLSTWLGGAFALYYVERHVNENFATPPRAIWSVLVYVSGGFQSRAPLTKMGELVAVFIVVTGVGVFAWFIAHFATRLITSHVRDEIKKLLLGRQSMHEMKEHIVIVNWDERVERMIRQIRDPDVTDRRAIVVISQNDVKFPDDPTFDQCFVVRGDARDRRTLNEAYAAQAYSVTITSSWHDDQAKDHHARSLAADAADSKTILTIVSLRAMANDCRPALPITAEILCSYNIGVATDAGRGGPTEIICVESFGTHVLTQCAVTPGLAALYEDLLTFAEGTDEIYKIGLPKQYVGKRFSHVLTTISAAQENRADNPVIPIGIYRKGAVLLNPGQEVLDEHDQLFVICDNPNVLLR